ncbi:ABC transporter ATP-binding protein [Brachybacterium hainanense]|uniref:ABC transporter ATP-binding protein n=1 Tax=Brachybacterium hainanense TaxID=1541174 RepID=A0ABV6RE77_9MICO
MDTITRSAPAISVRGLTKTYRSRSGEPVTAVRGVDLEIHAGEVFALLGPNGAGKSTTIEILTGFRTRSEGQVQVLGTDPQRPTRAWRSRLGLVPQETGDPGVATVREAIAHIGAIFPRSRDVDEVIAAVGLQEKARSPVRKLSGGQQRRVEVALAIIGRPELLFLDEPTTGFDPAARRQFWDLIRSLREDGTTIVLTTHYLDEAAALSDRAAVIARGRLVETAPIDEIGPARARTPVVRWRDGGGVPREQRTDEPGRLVRALAEHGEPAALEVVRPSLEDVYLALIGEQDDAEDPGVRQDRPAAQEAQDVQKDGVLA